MLDELRPMIAPAPTEQEAVAIAAAVEALWPKPMMLRQPARARSVAWQMSGRWWQRDRFADMQRPWR